MIRLKKQYIAQIEDRFRDVFRQFQKEWTKISGNQINRNEFAVLAMLQTGPLKASDISNTLRVSPSHITIVTDSLVRNELIIRAKDLSDRRVVLFRSSEKGTKLLEDLKRKKSEYIEKNFTKFSDEELKLFLKQG